MEKQFDKINMSLDEIIRTSRIGHPKLHNRTKTCAERSRSRSRSRSCSRSRSTSEYRGQQWRLERGQQQHITGDQPRRSRSRSRDSYRSRSRSPSLFSVQYTPPRYRSLPRQKYSFCNQKPAYVPHMGLRSGLGVNIRKYSLGFSHSIKTIRRPTTSLQQLRLAKKKIQVAKNILNARHRSYLKQLRQYRHEILEDSFQMPHYRLKNMRKFPDLDHNKISHHHIGRQRVYANDYGEGILSVTFENELANSQSHSHKVEGGTMCSGFKPSEALTAPRQTIINGCIIRNPSVENITNNDGVYMSTNKNVRQPVVTNSVDSLPVLVSSSDFSPLIYEPNKCNMAKKRIIHPANAVQTLNQRFSNYRVVCL